jgi:hypothetical protein
MKIKSVLKKTYSVVLILISVSANAQSQKAPDESQLLAGQCYSLPESKTYLDNLKTKPSSYSKMISELGSEKIANLQNTDSTNYYFCQVKCKNQSGSMETFWTTLSDSTARFSDMNGFLCVGISIENVQIVGSIYGPKPVIQTYWAFEHNLIETADWLRKINFKLPQDEFTSMLNSLRTTLKYIADSYITSTSPILISSGQRLSHFADGTSEGNLALRKYVVELARENWAPQKMVLGSTDYFTFTALNSQARFVEFAPSTK